MLRTSISIYPNPPSASDPIEEHPRDGQDVYDLESGRRASLGTIDSSPQSPRGGGNPMMKLGAAAVSIDSIDLAGLMAQQDEFAIFPRFGKLNILNLLHLQQHLWELERKLEELDLEQLTETGQENLDSGNDKPRQDSRTSGTSKMSRMSGRSIGFGGFGVNEQEERRASGVTEWYSMHRAAQIPELERRNGKKLPICLRRCRLMGEVERTLKGYNDALLAYSLIVSLPKASHRDARALNSWIQSSKSHNSTSYELAFLKEGSRDSIALAARETDILERFFQSRLMCFVESIPVWRRLFPSVRKAVTITKPTIQSKTTFQVIRFIISMGGAMFIIIPVVMLYFTSTDWARLVIIIVCTLAFTVLMHVFTAAEKKEVLVATTGYAAVLVVFVGADAFRGDGKKH
ncbi:hypothetical protein L873DRAFT_1798023 [Choiromyces venosus 120613-1]|uniref:DUF6594 domain-containing protein n=1 Tax=Choiromyces venosus 120613-1 TaxID=1336337 RepID=A0A3N4K758_9PEZI|nr:hypothetical protein L873DRAFT_1798023 [Choiromyces venosus 120613-1]